MSFLLGMQSLVSSMAFLPITLFFIVAAPMPAGLFETWAAGFFETFASKTPTGTEEICQVPAVCQHNISFPGTTSRSNMINWESFLQTAFKLNISSYRKCSPAGIDCEELADASGRHLQKVDLEWPNTCTLILYICTTWVAISKWFASQSLRG